MQVNPSGETGKYGLAPEAAAAFLPELSAFSQPAAFIAGNALTVPPTPRSA